MSVATWIAFVIAGTLIAISPGSGAILSMSHGLAYGVKKASATVLGSGLGGDSAISAGGERATGWAYPAFQERTFEGYRAFYAFVPKGKWSVEYTVRLNNPGQFNLPPTRVEAMYSPEMFGATPNAAMNVK